MSFMFKPLAYDDMNATNNLKIKGVAEEVGIGNDKVISGIVDKIEGKITILDGYVGASIDKIVKEIKSLYDKDLEIINIEDYFKTEEELDEIFLKYLPLNYEDDPVLLFGFLSEDDFSIFFDNEKLKGLEERLNNKETIIIYGHGSGYKEIRKFADNLIWVDVIPKITAIRARENKFHNIGTDTKIPFNLLMRRNYFVDFGVVLKLRQELIDNDQIDLYIIDNDENNLISLPFSNVKKIFRELSKRPFRAKPVYLDGIWGGEFIRKVRNIPKDIAPNIAWIFEFIPMEVSIATVIDDIYLDFPFYTFLQEQKTNILGQKAYDDFGGYFPIRFNYDDTWHSDGNMSIQVHPNEEFIKEHYNELGSQDEAYYIISTGHGAKTYAGFKKDGREFLEMSKEAEEDGRILDYQEYIHGVDSKVGMQAMIPAGTIHASGQNQFILELGSLTIGSYTYKVYDYQRRDAEGKLRPIHTKNAEQVLEFERDEKWVHENIIVEPKLVGEQESSKEYLVGKTDLMYYETYRIEMETGGKYEGSNNNQFTVLTIVDGEEVVIYSKSNPDYYYEASFLDIITVPASIDDYIIEAKGYQPVVVHKTILV